MLIDNNIIDIIINEEEKNKFYDDIKKIYKYSKNNDIYLGIDFEFNTKKIALMQLLFEIRLEKPDKIEVICSFVSESVLLKISPSIYNQNSLVNEIRFEFFFAILIIFTKLLFK